MKLCGIYFLKVIDPVQLIYFKADCLGTGNCSLRCRLTGDLGTVCLFEKNIEFYFLSCIRMYLLNLESDGFLRLTFGVEFPEHNFEFRFLWFTLAYFGSSTLVLV